MTIEQLFVLQKDTNKLMSLQLELAKHENFNPYKKNIISDMPKGNNERNFLEEYVEKKEKLEQQIEFYKKKIQEDRRIIDEYIEAAPYPECSIIRYKVINNMSWEDIGDCIGYSRRHVAKRFWNYINDQNDRNDHEDM